MPYGHDYEALKEILGGQGLDIDDELKRAVSEGRWRTTTAAIGGLLRESEIERSAPTAVKGYWLGVTKTQFDQLRGRILTPNGVVELVNPPQDIPQYAYTTLEGIIAARNVRTKRTWHEVPKEPQVAWKRGTLEEFCGLLQPLSATRGLNTWVATRAPIQWVNKKPKYDPNRQFVKGSREQIPTFPVYSPENGQFALRVTLVDGEENVNVNIADLSLLDGLFPMTELDDGFYSWFKNAETPDEERFQELNDALRGKELIVIGRGGDQIQERGKAEAKEVSTPFLSLSGGLIMRFDRFEEEFTAAQGRLPPENTAPSRESAPVPPTPGPAAGPATGPAPPTTSEKKSPEVILAETKTGLVVLAQARSPSLITREDMVAWGKERGHPDAKLCSQAMVDLIGSNVFVKRKTGFELVNPDALKNGAGAKAPAPAPA